MTYIISGYSGTGGLGSDASKDALQRSKLAAQVKAGVPGAQAALNTANQIAPAQASWDKAAAAMRAAGMPAVLKLPAVAQPAAKKALEDQIVSTLGPRPKTPTVVGSSLPPSIAATLTQQSSPVSTGDEKKDNTTLYIGAAAVVGAALLFMRR